MITFFRPLTLRRITLKQVMIDLNEFIWGEKCVACGRAG